MLLALTILEKRRCVECIAADIMRFDQRMSLHDPDDYSGGESNSDRFIVHGIPPLDVLSLRNKFLAHRRDPRSM